MDRRLVWRWVAAMVCVWSLSLPCGQAQTSRLPTIRLSGRDYVRVTDAARVYGMKVSVQGRMVSMSSQYATIRLELDSREASFNGLKLWLSAPPIVARGMTVIAHSDLVKVLEPILFPPRNSTPSSFRAIVIDPGHGGADDGTRSAGGMLEKTLVLDVSKRLQQILARQGHVVSLTRTKDRTLALDDRVNIAKQLRADLFVSVHFNSEGRGRSASGIETYCLTPSGTASTASTRSLSPHLPGNRYDDRNMLLAYTVQRNLVAATRAPDRGVRRARFYVLQYAQCPAILVECGFLSNQSEAGQISSANYRERIANGIAEGILAYRRTVER